jgi:tetrahydromethanopterin S-methyltransferase subunit G
MNTNKINMKDVYEFLEERQAKAINEKFNSIEEEIENMRREVVEDITSKVGGLEEVANKFKEIHEIVSEISSHLAFTYGDLNQVLRVAGNLSNLETLERNIIDATYDNDEIKQKQVYRRNIEDEIKNEFAKLKEMVKNCSTVEQAVRNLEKIGFDVTSLKPEEKQEFNFNKDLLGL